MRKLYFFCIFFFSFFASVYAIGPISIVFKTATTDGSTEIKTSTQTTTVIHSGVQYVSGFTCSCSKAYYNGKSGVKVGSSNNPGTFEFNLASGYQNNVKSITVTTAKFGSDTGKLKMYCNGATALNEAITPNDIYTHTFDNPTTVSSLKFVTTTKRAYISTIKITYAEEQPVAEYTAIWYLDGEGYDITETSGGKAVLPETPANNAIGDCANVFVGWTATPLGSTLGQDKPSDLFTSTNPPTLSANAEFYAVFATKDGGETIVEKEKWESSFTEWGVSKTEWLRNNNAELPTFRFAPNYEVGKIVLNVRQSNATGSNSIEVKIDGQSFGTKVNSLSGNEAYDITFEDRLMSGEVEIICTNTSSAGTGKGTFYMNSIALYGASVTYSNYVTECAPKVECTEPDEALALSVPANIELHEEQGSVETSFSISGGNGGAVKYAISPAAAINGTSITFTQEGTYTLTATQDVHEQGGTTYCGGTATATIQVDLIRPTYSLVLNDRGVATVWKEDNEGASIPAPADPTGVCTVPVEYVFDGWATAEIDAAGATSYTKVSFPYTMPKGGATLYAVYRWADGISNDYKQISYASDIESGADYLIVGNNSSTYRALSDIAGGAEGQYTTVSVTPKSQIITTEDASLIWRIDMEDDTYTLYSADVKKYANINQNVLSLAETPTPYRLSVQSSKFTFSSTDETSPNDKPCLSYYNSQKIFNAYYNSNTVYVYKRQTAYAYTTAPICGAYISIKDGKDIYVTGGVASSGRNTVQAQQTVQFQAGSLQADGGKAPIIQATITDNVVSCDIAQESTLSADGTYSIVGTAVVSYTPTAHNKLQDITVNLTATGNDEAVATFNVHVRSLPERFVIVGQLANGDWCALNGDMPNANTHPANTHIEVDNAANPTKALITADNTVYTFDGLQAKSDRLQCVRFIGSNGGYLWTSDDSRNIRNWAKDTPEANNNNYNWLLQTEDNVNYVFANRINTRTLSVYNDRFGMYVEENGIHRMRILPIDATCAYNYAPTNLKATEVSSTSATLEWTAVEGAERYQYSIDEGTTWQDADATPRLTLSGLTSLTVYTVYVRAIHGEENICSDIASVAFATPNCDDVPTDIAYTATMQSITVEWTAQASIATVNLYYDEACTDFAAGNNNVSSPATIEGLEANTTYYMKVLADGSCPSQVIEVKTESPKVEIVEWQTNGIKVNVNTNEKVQVSLEGQTVQGTGEQNVAEDLFFSKYFEATGNVKLLGVYNGTGKEQYVGDIQIWIGVSKWDNKIVLRNYVKDKVGYMMAPDEEILLYSTQGRSQDADIHKCAEEAYPNAPWQLVDKNSNIDGSGSIVFSGKQTIALYRGNVLIDVIGAVKNGSPNNAGATNQPIWGDDPGWICPTGRSIKTGEVIGLSTNRCLLIRSNKVKSGMNAVAKNVDDFVTLCEGWTGEHVPKYDADNGVQATCDNLVYVEKYDYSDYYEVYEPIGTTQVFDESSRNPDGTITIQIDGLSDMACRGLRINVMDTDGESLLSSEHKVPIIVTKETTTAGDVFQAHEVEKCKDCDVVVRDNATLTKAAEGTPEDRAEVRNMYVYAGATLCIPENTAYKVNGLALKRDNADNVAALDISAADGLHVANGEVYVDMRIDAQNWHWFALPFDCKVADVRWSNGKAAERGTDWLIATYNGKRRADAGSSNGNWEHYTGDVIEAGKGYIVGIAGNPSNPKQTYELRFPMSASAVMSAEQTDKNVPVFAYGAGKENLKPNHKGWNLVGNPYLNHYMQDAANPFEGWRLGYLVYDDQSGTFDVVNDNNPYLVIPENGGWTSYKQQLVSDVPLAPFTSYFVQVGKDEGYADGQECAVQFRAVNRGGKANVMQRLIAADTDAVESAPVIVGVVLSNGNGEQDETSLVLSEQFSRAYEMGADFFKWFGDYYRNYTKPVVYTMGADGGKRAFNALNADDAVENIPMGMFAARAGEYTFTLDRRYDDSRVDKVWLFDAERGVHTNLLEEDYRFATARNEGEGRFFLSVALRSPAVTTDSGAAETEGVRLMSEGLHLLLRGLPAEAEVWVYDPTGKLLVHEHTRHYERQYSVPQQGAYMVRVVSDDQTVTLRTICK